MSTFKTAQTDLHKFETKLRAACRHMRTGSTKYQAAGVALIAAAVPLSAHASTPALQSVLGQTMDKLSAIANAANIETAREAYADLMVNMATLHIAAFDALPDFMATGEPTTDDILNGGSTRALQLIGLL